ncbi:MAG: FISUMP domain-containing protein [Bacteroidota bacterium]
MVNVTNTTISISATILYLYPNSSDVILTICTNSSFTTGCLPPITLGQTPAVGVSPISYNYTISSGLSPNTTYFIKLSLFACGIFKTTSATTTSCSCNYTKPIAPTIPIVNCKLVKIDWILNTCADYYTLEVGPVSNSNFPVLYNVGKNTTYSITSTTGFPVGTYKVRIRYRYKDCADNIDKWSAYSDITYFTITSTVANAGPDKSIPVCTTGINGIQLQATAISGGKWSIVSSSPAGYTGNFYGSVSDPNAYFQFTNYGANSFTLRWGNECSSDLMMVYTSFVCGTDLTDSRDSKVYTTRSYNGKCWFTKNLNYGTPITWVGGHPSVYSSTNDATWPASNSSIVKYCLNNNTANCSAYGGLYLGDIAALSQLCPPCWHVATDDEWTSLANYANTIAPNFDAAKTLKGSTIGFDALKANSTASGTNPDGNLTTGFLNDSYLTRNNFGYGYSGVYFYLPGLPAISNNHNGGFDYQSAGQFNNFWTSTPYNTTDNYNPYSTRYGGTSTGWAYLRTFSGQGSSGSGVPFRDNLIRDKSQRRSFAFHVRCVRD